MDEGEEPADDPAAAVHQWMLRQAAGCVEFPPLEHDALLPNVMDASARACYAAALALFACDLLEGDVGVDALSRFLCDVPDSVAHDARASVCSAISNLFLRDRSEMHDEVAGRLFARLSWLSSREGWAGTAGPALARCVAWRPDVVPGHDRGRGARRILARLRRTGGLSRYRYWDARVSLACTEMEWGIADGDACARECALHLVERVFRRSGGDDDLWEVLLAMRQDLQSTDGSAERRARHR